MAEPTVPESFASLLGDREGAAGQRWLAGLPALAVDRMRAWDLRQDGRALHGYVGLVLPVRRADGGPAMLKLSWRDTETFDEPVALSRWNGRGAVRLLERDDGLGAMLLERLDSGRMLDGEPISTAVTVAGELLRRLAVPSPPLRRGLRAEAARWAAAAPVLWRRLGGPFPRGLLDAAVGCCRELGPEAGTLLVNEDLHYENVLRGEREPWLVIDPKPLTGDLEFAMIPLLWNRMSESTLDERCAGLVSAAGLDRTKALSWTLVRAVQNWLWAIEDEEDDFVLHAVSAIAPWAAERLRSG